MQDISTLERIHYVASKCQDLTTHWHGVIFQKNRLSTCFLHVFTAKLLPYLTCGTPLCTDVQVSLCETWEYSHKNLMLKTTSRGEILSYMKTFKRFYVFINGWNKMYVQFKNG
jgi:hypothetical protein